METKIFNCIKVKDYVDFVSQFYAGDVEHGIIDCNVYKKASFNKDKNDGNYILTLESTTIGAVITFFEDYYLFGIAGKQRWCICKEMPVGESWHTVKWLKKGY